MAKTRQEKEQTVTTLAKELEAATSVVFANFQGLSMKDIDELRKSCKEQGVQLRANKKTLLKLALKNTGLDVDTKEFVGGVATFTGSDDITAAKIVATFAKTHEVVKIFGGIFEKAFIGEAQVKALSAIPSRHELLGRLVGTLNAPVSGFVNVLAGNLRGLVTVLSAIKDQKV